jgi:FkbM family methyltransferase
MSGVVDHMRTALAELDLPAVVLADIGARGGLQEPWDALTDAVRVIGFEPDEAECARLNAEVTPGRTFLPVALWSTEGTIDVHVAKTPSCSSVHPPNRALLERYAARHATPRETDRVVTVPTQTLDSVAAQEELDVDFVKIDTQGSEYEILLGARKTMRNQAVGALVETWTAEVHEGQHLSGEVLTLMHDYGFELFDVGVAAAWQRRTAEMAQVAGKAQVMGLDLLFFRPTSHPTTKAAKLAAIANIFGFPDFALAITDGADGLASLREAILTSRAGKPAARRGWQRVLRRPRPQPAPYPSLHS